MEKFWSSVHVSCKPILAINFSIRNTKQSSWKGLVIVCIQMYNKHVQNYYNKLPVFVWFNFDYNQQIYQDKLRFM